MSSLRLLPAVLLVASSAAPARAQGSPPAERLPSKPAAEETIAALRALASGVAEVRCSTTAPRPLAGLERDLPASAVSAVRIDCNAEMRENRVAGAAGFARFIDGARQLPGLILVESLDYQARPEALRLGLQLLLPFASGGDTSEQARRRGASTAERLSANSRWPFLILDALLAMGYDTVKRGIHVEGWWRSGDDGKSYSQVPSPTWTATEIGRSASAITQPEMEYPWGFGRLTLSPQGVIGHRTLGSCVVFEMKGLWSWDTSAPSSSADASADPPRYGENRGLYRTDPKSALTDQELCGSRRDPDRGRVLVTSAPGRGLLTLRLRDVDLADVFAILGRLTGQGFVVDPDVVGRATLELERVTPEQVIAATEKAAGLSVSPPGSIRRVSRGQRARAWSFPKRDASGHAISLNVKREPFENLMRLFADISGLHVEVPSVRLETVTAQIEDKPWDEIFVALLAVQDLSWKIDDDVLRIRRSGAATKPLDRIDREEFKSFADFAELRFTGIVANADPARAKRLAAYYQPSGLLLAEPTNVAGVSTVTAAADDQLAVQWTSYDPHEPDGMQLRLALPALSDSTSADPPDGSDPASVVYARVAASGLGVPIDARSRLGLQRLLLHYFRDIGEAGMARRAARDAIAAAMPLQIEPDTQLAMQAALILEEARALGVPADALYEKLRALGPAFQVLAAGPAPISIRSSSFRATGLRSVEGAWLADGAAVGRGKLIFRVGDRLADGSVKSIDKDRVIVEAELPVAGKPAVKRLLRFNPPTAAPPITPGRDTTWITAPLLSDGTPDYGKWLNDKYGEGVTPANNAAELLQSKRCELVDAGLTFYDGAPGARATRWYAEPWLESDCAVCAERLRKNEAPLAAVAEAVRRPRYYVPGPAGVRLWNSPMPSLLRLRLPANALAGRGMLRLSSGDFKGAREDALTVQRLAVVLGQGPTLIERLIAIAVRGIGAPLLGRIASAPPLAADSRRLLQQLQALPPLPHPVETLHNLERVGSLDAVLLLRQSAAELGPGGMVEEIEPDYLLQIGGSRAVDQMMDEQPGELDWRGHPVVYLVPPRAFDWDEALRLVNREFDLAVAEMQAVTQTERRLARSEAAAHNEAMARQRTAALDTLRAGVRSEATQADDVAAAAEALARTSHGRKQLASLLAPLQNLSRASISWNEAEALFQLQVAAVALAAHRFEKGAYPATFAPATPTPGYVIGSQLTAATYALTAVPEERAVTGNRGFCVDSTGATRFTTDGTAPKIVNGVCDPQVPLLR